MNKGLGQRNLVRLIRDLSLLVAFCVTVFVAAQLIGGLAPSNDHVHPSSAFSELRLEADRYFQMRDWIRAGDSYAKMVEEDPYNPHATFRRAACSEALVNRALIRLNSMLDADPRDDTAIELLREEIDTLQQDAIEAFYATLRFPRYLNVGRYRLARLYAQRGDREPMFEHLRQAIADFSATRDGLWRDPAFLSYHDDPEFRELAISERQIRRNPIQ